MVDRQTGREVIEKDIGGERKREKERRCEI